MRTIRPISSAELETFVDITANAYPGIDLFSAESRRQFRTRIKAASQQPEIHLVGLFDDDRMIGGMRLYDFTVRLLTRNVLAGGVGGIGVDLLRKKERAAYEMMQFFLRHYYDQGACLVVLYPFRPDFYKRMGFGFSTKLQRYAFDPTKLPANRAKKHLHSLTKADKAALAACYERFQMRTNGLFVRFDQLWDTFLEADSLHVVGVKRDDAINGYVIFQFERGQKNNFLDNDLLIRELVYDTAADLEELLAFLRSQADQVKRIIFNTQDENFYFLLDDPRNGTQHLLTPTVYHETNTEGVGLMVRVIDAARLFVLLGEHDFNGQTCCIALELHDSFFPQNAGRTVISFVNGRCRLTPGVIPDVTITMDVAEFSSLVTGAVRFGPLVGYGLATISDPTYSTQIDRLFAAPKPLCMTSF